MEDSLPHTPNRTHKGKAVGLRPHLKSCHCLWSYIVKSVSEQRFPLTAACALRLGRCVQTGVSQLPQPWGSSCTQSIHAGHLLLACPPHITHLDSPTMCGATCCWPLLASIHPSRLMSYPAPSTSADGHCSPRAELVSRALLSPP